MRSTTPSRSSSSNSISASSTRQRFQDWAEHFTPLIVSANYFYGSLHFIVTIFAGVFLYRRYSDDYPRFRNALGITTALALIGFTLYPLTPPRLCTVPASYGFSDTLAQYPTFWSFNSGGDEEPLEPVRGDAERALRVVRRGVRSRSCLGLKSRTWRILGVLYPLMTLFVIVITGNHYLLDAVGGWIILAIGWFLSGLVTRAGRARRVPDRRWHSLPRS